VFFFLHFWHTCYLPDESLIWMPKCVLAKMPLKYYNSLIFATKCTRLITIFSKLRVSVSAAHTQHALCSRLFYPVEQGLVLRETPLWIQCFGCVAHLHMTCAELKPVIITMIISWLKANEDSSTQLRDKVDIFLLIFNGKTWSMTC
jgi:hypothetical protein